MARAEVWCRSGGLGTRGRLYDASEGTRASTSRQTAPLSRMHSGRGRGPCGALRVGRRPCSLARRLQRARRSFRGSTSLGCGNNGNRDGVRVDPTGVRGRLSRRAVLCVRASGHMRMRRCAAGTPGVIVEVLETGGAATLVKLPSADKFVRPRVDAHPIRLHTFGARD